MSEVLERPATSAPITMTPDAMIDRYVRIRDKKKEIEKRQAEELAPYNEALNRLEAWLLEALNSAGLQNMKSPHGTAFKALRTSATVKDREAFLAYVREHEAWDLLESRVSKTAAFAVMEETKAPIPGVETTSEVVLSVRRAGGTGEKL